MANLWSSLQIVNRQRKNIKKGFQKAASEILTTACIVVSVATALAGDGTGKT